MRNWYRTSALLVAAVLFLPLTSAAQIDNRDLNNLGDLRGVLQAIGQDYADSYVQPVTDIFGAGVNGGLFRSADVGNSLIPGFPLDVYVGVNVSAPFTGSMDRRFAPSGEEVITDGQGRRLATVRFTPAGAEVPTAIGETETPSAQLTIENERTGQQTTISAPPGLLDTPLAPVPLPQLSVGSVAGTDVQLRYFPKTNLSGYGKVGLFGVAVRHDIDQWFPAPLPINLAVQIARNQFSLEAESPNAADSGFQEVLDGSGWAFNLQASRGVPVLPVIFYGGLQYETFGVDYSYRYDPGNGIQPVDISVSQDAANNVRALAGVTFTLAVLRFNVDYAISTHNVLTAGVGVRL